MTGKEAMRYVMGERRLSQQEVANRAGYARQTNVSEVLRSDNARIDNILRIVNACGYDIVVVDRENPDKKIVLSVKQGGEADE